MIGRFPKKEKREISNAARVVRRGKKLKNMQVASEPFVSSRMNQSPKLPQPRTTN